MTQSERKARLEALLLGFQDIWRPQPFKTDTPAWCTDYPALTAELLALDDEAVDRLTGDNPALIGSVARHVPALAELAALITLPPSPGAPRQPPPRAGEARLCTDIPGRKQAQIAAYAEALGEPRAPLLEWCAGKGHLGRLLAHRWQRPVASLEIDATLCANGEALARRAGVEDRQRFIRADALAAESARHLSGRHAVALHACGDLHKRLLAAAAEQASPALDLAPCCYYRTADPAYRPFNPSALELGHDDLRLAVTDAVTASPLELRRSRQAMAWKLGWVELRRAITGDPAYHPFPPVPEAWLRGDFTGFVERMRERHMPGIPLPQPSPASGGGLGGGFEALGHARAARLRRLQLVRLAFRRALEVWLLMDMAVFLEHRDYRVTVAPFCPPGLTPRNLLLSARRYNPPR